MSVKKSYRKESPLQFKIGADKIWSLVWRAILEDFLLDNDTLTMYRRLVTDTEDTLRNVSKHLVTCVEMANTYPTCREEYVERRLWQDKAIADCKLIKKAIQNMLLFIGLNENRYFELVKACDKEFTVIYAWRKSDNPRFRSIL